MRNKHRHLHTRKNNGQALIEATCGTVLMITIFVLLTAFAINAFFAFTYSTRLQIIANEVAKMVNNHTYWNGALRPQFQRNNTAKTAMEQKARDYATALGRDLGLPSTPVVNIPAEPTVQGSDFAYSKITVSLPQVPLPYTFNRLFPNFLSISAVGIASEASEVPPGFIRLGYRIQNEAGNIVNPDNTYKTQVCIIPCYGFQTDPSSNTGSGNATLGGTHNNDDVVANQPDASKCVWNGLNVSGYKTVDENGQSKDVYTLTGPHPMTGSTPLDDIPAANQF